MNISEDHSDVLYKSTYYYYYYYYYYHSLSVQQNLITGASMCRSPTVLLFSDFTRLKYTRRSKNLHLPSSINRPKQGRILQTAPHRNARVPDRSRDQQTDRRTDRQTDNRNATSWENRCAIIHAVSAHHHHHHHLSFIKS